MSPSGKAGQGHGGEHRPSARIARQGKEQEEILVTEENLFSNCPIGFFQLDSAHINKQNRMRKNAKSIYQVLKNESVRNSFKFVC